METQSNPLESRLFQTYWDDGLLDLLSGLALLTIGLAWNGGLGPLAVVFAPVWIVMWRPLRHRIVEPRAGFVRFSLNRERRVEHDLKGTLAFGLGLLALIALGAFGAGKAGSFSETDNLVAGLPAALVALAAVFTGFLTGARRFHVYAFAMLAAAALVGLFADNPGLPILGGGLVVSASGAFLLARFLRESEAYDDGD